MRHNFYLLIITICGLTIASCQKDEPTTTSPVPSATVTSVTKPVATQQDHHRNKIMCPDCQNWKCIYQEIKEVAKDATDSELEIAIFKVVSRRNISDSATIDNIRKNFYL